jgi:acetylornithine deacetylase/succinyl-diaminopimelate desuccinylase-like protein
MGNISAVTYARANRHRFLHELKEFLRIPSVSALPEHQNDMSAAAEFVRSSLLRTGMENVSVIRTDGHPLVYADWLNAPGRPTCLCYGHYDVQPVDPIEEWRTAPFEPAEHEGNLYARGASDDKGQLYSQLKALESLFHVHGGKLPINVRILVEGEEEIGGKHVAQFICKNANTLTADVALVTDTKMLAPDVPTLCVGLRGIAYVEIEAHGPAVDLHSGIYGGNIQNPLIAMAQIICRLKDEKGKITVPGFYDRVAPISVEEKASWRRIAADIERSLQDRVGTALCGEDGYTPLERAWGRPTLDVHGIIGGFGGDGPKTVIPANALAKLSMRIVPDMRPAEVITQVRNFIHEIQPSGIRVNLREIQSAPAVVVDVHDKYVEIAADVLRQVFGNRTVFVRSGGSIPIVSDFQTYLGIPTLLMGFGLPDDNTHAPNEKFGIRNFFKGIEAVIRLMERLKPVA